MAWSKIKCSAAKGHTAPGPRGYHTATLVENNKILIYGGSDGQECFADVHVLDTDTDEWTRLRVANPSPRLAHAASAVGSKLFVFGGHDGSEYVNELNVLDLGTVPEPSLA